MCLNILIDLQSWLYSNTAVSKALSCLLRSLLTLPPPSSFTFAPVVLVQLLHFTDEIPIQIIDFLYEVPPKRYEQKLNNYPDGGVGRRIHTVWRDTLNNWWLESHFALPPLEAGSETWYATFRLTIWSKVSKNLLYMVEYEEKHKLFVFKGVLWMLILKIF